MKERKYVRTWKNQKKYMAGEGEEAFSKRGYLNKIS